MAVACIGCEGESPFAPSTVSSNSSQSPTLEIVPVVVTPEPSPSPEPPKVEPPKTEPPKEEPPSVQKPNVRFCNVNDLKMPLSGNQMAASISGGKATISVRNVTDNKICQLLLLSWRRNDLKPGGNFFDQTLIGSSAHTLNPGEEKVFSVSVDQGCAQLDIINGTTVPTDAKSIAGTTVRYMIVGNCNPPDPCLGVSGDVGAIQIGSTATTTVFQITANTVKGVGTLNIDGQPNSLVSGTFKKEYTFNRPFTDQPDLSVKGNLEIANEGKVCVTKSLSFVVKSQIPPVDPCLGISGKVSVVSTSLENTIELTQSFRVTAEAVGGTGVIKITGQPDKSFTGAIQYELTVNRPSAEQGDQKVTGAMDLLVGGKVCKSELFTFVVKAQISDLCKNAKGGLVYKSVSETLTTETFHMTAGLPDGYAIVKIPGLLDKQIPGVNGGKTEWDVTLTRPTLGQPDGQVWGVMEIYIGNVLCAEKKFLIIVKAQVR